MPTPPTAVKFVNPDFTHNALTRHRPDGMMKARAELLKSLPAEPEAPKVNAATVLAARAPRTEAGAHAGLTQADMNAAPSMSQVQSIFGALLVQLQTRSIEVPPEQGSVEE